jgi:hypothetical protein
MGKWINKSLQPTVSPDSEDHIAIEDLARLADGTVDRAERERFTRHINRCQRCYEILQQTLTGMPQAASAQPDSSDRWWKTKAVYALAASIILVFIVAGQLGYKYWMHPPRILSATLDLDQELKDILMEDDALQWEKGARLNRLEAAFVKKGLQFGDLSLAVLTKPYYQKKSLFGPREVLHVRIENGVAYLEVQEMPK